MSHPLSHTINLRGSLYDLGKPRVMGIINVTPDSFYSGSRVEQTDDIKSRALSMLENGADILDLGGYSSRPGAEEVTAEQEYHRLATGLEAIRRVAPEAIVSVDTFRASVAERCVREWGADIINDISAGMLDPDMPAVAAELHVPVIVMHMRGTPATMQQLTRYNDPVADTISELATRISIFRNAGVSDVIADPGFGFAKTVEQNYMILRHLEEFRMLDCPLLVGISRKSMIYKPLGITAAESLAGTIALDMVCLMKGAAIIRVHDVKQAVQSVKLFNIINAN